ncbi:MAG: hypothetical protein AAFX94_22325 [Myxococcota bacterium]
MMRRGYGYQMVTWETREAARRYAAAVGVAVEVLSIDEEAVERLSKVLGTRPAEISFVRSDHQTEEPTNGPPMDNNH